MQSVDSRLATILAEAVEIASQTERQAYLDRCCGGDPELRREAQALVDDHFRAGSFLENPAALAGTLDQPGTERPGTVIGPYKLLQQIGEGGMGTVFMAEQSKPVRRKVALKIIKAGMDTGQVVARFEAERQTLAMMDHPNIAKILDAGTTGESRSQNSEFVSEKSQDRKLLNSDSWIPNSSSRPYFVMELVKGIPITEFCNRQKLATRARLDLFITVCRAVQHAHQKGVIHRDLKPSNILVELHDVAAVPKVIDFGVAKATHQQLTERTLFTNFDQMIGTPLYMSPEQAQLSGLDIDTRSDVYSLGVLLYELLTGTTPFDGATLRKAGYDEMRRIIREDEPPRPSSRLSELSRSRLPAGTEPAAGPTRQSGSTSSLASISADRSTDPAKLSKLLRGELDWIVMKCLEKDRTRRYESTSAFAADVQRYLNDEPVQACPPSTGYRLRKFVRRHKRTLVTGALLGVMLLAAVGVVAGNLGWTARDRAARRAEAAQQVGESLARARAWIGDNKLELARQELAEAKGRIGNDRAALPVLAEEIDSLDAALARFQGFLDLIEQAHEAETRLTEGLALTAEADGGTKAAPSSVNSSDRDPAKAVPFLLKALTRYEVMENDDWLAALEGARLKAGQVRQVRRSAYEELLWLAADVVRRGHNHRSGGILSPAQAAGEGLVYLHRAEAAWRPTAALYRIRAACHRALGEKEAARADEALARQTSPAIALDHYLLGVAAQAAGDKAEGVRQFEAALRLEPTHYWSLMSLGTCLADLGDKEQDFAAATVAFTGGILKRPEHAPAWHNRGFANMRLRQYDQALADYSKAVELKPNYPWAWNNRGTAHFELGQYDQALADYNEAIEIKPDFADAWYNRGAAHVKLGQYDKALADTSKAIEVKPDYAEAWSNRGVVHGKLGQYDQALANYSKAIELKPVYALAWSNRGNAYQDLNQYDQALADFSKAIELKPDYADAWFGRGNAYRHRHQYDQALADFSKLIQLKPDVAKAWNNRGVIHKDLGQYDQALADYSRAIELEPDYAGAWDNRGIAHRHLRQYAKALADHSKAIEIAPDLAEAWDNRGLTHQGLGQNDQALADYSKAIELKPDYAGAWTNRGGVYVILGQYDKALADVSKAIEIKPDLAEAWDNRGSAHAGLGQYAEAVADHSKAIEIKPDFAGAWSNRGASQLDLGQYDQALADCSKAIELKPDYAKAWGNRGNAHAGLRQYDKALADQSKAIELKPDLAVAWYSRGIAHGNLGQNEKALADFSKAIELKPADAKAWQNRGIAQANLGQYAQALADFSQAIELKPHDAGAWNGRGIVQVRLRQYDKAVADFSQAIELKPNLAKAWKGRGAALVHLRQYDQAVADFSEAIKLKPDDAEAWKNRGIAHGHLRQYDKAIADCEKSLELAPADAGVSNGLAWLLATCPDPAFRDLARAIILAKKAVALAPQGAGGWNTLGVAHYRAGEWKAASEALNKSVELGQGGDANDWFFLAMTHWQLGDKVEARKWYDQAAKWMENNAPQEEELRRFHTEAEESLEIKKNEL